MPKVKEGDELQVLYGEYKGRIGTVKTIHVKDVSLEFSDGDRASFSWNKVVMLKEKQE